MKGNGASVQAVQVPVLRLLIEYLPQQGQLRVQWPEVDDIAKLGLLEMAKQVLAEARTRAMLGVETPKLVTPTPGAVKQFS